MDNNYEWSGSLSSLQIVKHRGDPPKSWLPEGYIYPENGVDYCTVIVDNYIYFHDLIYEDFVFETTDDKTTSIFGEHWLLLFGCILWVQVPEMHVFQYGDYILWRLYGTEYTNYPDPAPTLFLFDTRTYRQAFPEAMSEPQVDSETEKILLSCLILPLPEEGTHFKSSIHLDETPRSFLKKINDWRDRAVNSHLPLEVAIDEDCSRTIDVKVIINPPHYNESHINLGVTPCGRISIRFIQYPWYPQRIYTDDDFSINSLSPITDG